MSKCKVIVNADDFGFCEAVNYGILKAHKEGIVRSTSLMANMPGFDHAVKLAKENPTLQIGAHLTINAFQPLTDGGSLKNENGMFDRRLIDQYDEEEVFQEFVAQIEKIKAAGIVIDHLDSHRHVHQEVKLQRVMERILQKYPLPIRGGFHYPCDYPYQTVVNDEFYGRDVSEEKMIKILKSLKEGNIYDIVTHPAYVDGFLADSSSYVLERTRELDILCSRKIKRIIEDLDIELTTYSCF